MKNYKNIISSILSIMSFALCFTSCDNNGDHTGENWILALIVLLAWLKGSSK